MRDRPCVVGIDVGTTGCKAAVFDASGTEVSRDHVGYDVMRGDVGIVEQNPEIWWGAARDAVRRAVRCAGTAIDIVAAGVSSSNALLAVGADGNPLRPAIMQLDRRADPQAQRLRAELGAERTLQRTGNPISAGASWLPTLRWLQEQEPSTIPSATTFLFPGGWVAYRLTGVAAVDHSRACTTQLLDPIRLVWCPELLKAVGVREEQMPRLCSATEAAGPLRREVANDLGLPAGIPVLCGPMDSVAAALGSGAVGPHDAAVVLGTIGRVLLVKDCFVPDPRHLTTIHAVPSRWLSIGAVWGAGTALSRAARWSGRQDYGRLERDANAVPPGACGLIFVPSTGQLSTVGERAVANSQVGGDVDLPSPQLRRAILEGISLALAQQASILERSRAISFPSLVVSGGGCRSRLLRQLLADVLGVPVAVTASVDTEPRGAAMLAAVAAGLFADVDSAVGAMAAKPVAVAAPNTHVRSLYEGLRNEFDRLSS